MCFKPSVKIETLANSSPLVLHSALQTGNTSYDPMGACQTVYIGSRDDMTWSDFISPSITLFMTEAVAHVGTQWTYRVMQNATTNTSLIRSATNVRKSWAEALSPVSKQLHPPPRLLCVSNALWGWRHLLTIPSVALRYLKLLVRQLDSVNTISGHFPPTLSFQLSPLGSST